MPILKGMNTNTNCRAFGKLATVLVASVFLCVGYAEDGPKKISKSEGMNAVTSKVPPDYPAIAKQLKIEGPVELEAVVTESGTVEKVNIVSGNPVLTRPAAEALKKWKFAPFTSEGKTVKALVPVSLSFHM
uniref:Protein TonB n=1 Tax=Solibacter usitatus (strain Ellin6076) TaxID=234267 RepID=Q021K1_SOLUE